ncbi:LysM peptidoglycan-binding domain-containing protein [Kocuria sp.]|uniref:lytic transglycosylase n=1 Tax=Kocuria sp. TaxID=1871328 RepID=UPI0026DD3A16|nr:LysM peptidoglycan-binding domain-containing protein [Kocuria sp.]MDO4919965.1 LysM peptidoglycan-binding domain-containing protein [Kocuria sp.]
MPIEPPQDRPAARTAWSRRAAQGSAAALAALTALGPLQAAHATPASPQTVHVAQQHGPSRITVAPGDSLWSLATSHGVTVKELMDTNSIPAHGMLRPGQRLDLPAARQPESSAPDEAAAHPASRRTTAAGAATAPAAAATSRASTAGSTTAGNTSGSSTETSGGSTAPAAGERHTVVAGDTLWELSRQHGVSVAALMSANGLRAGAALRPGDTLVVPGGTAEGSAARQADGEQAGAERDSTERAGAERGAAASSGEDRKSTTAQDSPAGREHPAEVTAAAAAHREQLRQRPLPTRDEVRELVASTARDMGVDPALALAHASQESGFDQGAVSPADAVGAMQVVPAAGAWASAMVGRELDLLDARDNVTAGVAIIRELQAKAPDRATGIAAYYQGLHGVRTYGLYSDTKAYVKAVSAQERRFAQ